MNTRVKSFFQSHEGSFAAKITLDDSSLQKDKAILWGMVMSSTDDTPLREFEEAIESIRAGYEEWKLSVS